MTPSTSTAFDRLEHETQRLIDLSHELEQALDALRGRRTIRAGAACTADGPAPGGREPSGQ